MSIRKVLTNDFEYISESGVEFEKFRNKTFFVTGATGLIGSLLIKSLIYCNEKYELNLKIYALVRSAEKAQKIFEDYDQSVIEYVVGNIELDNWQIDEKVDFIIHAAAVTTSKIMVSDPVGTIQTAVIGTEKILKLAARNKASAMVYISSMEIYGQPSVTGRTTEMDLGFVDLTNVRSCYPEGKRMCECLCTAYASQYGVNVKSARLAQTFGAGVLDGDNRVFAQFARSAMEGKDIVLHTTGESEGNYVYTADAIVGILMLLQKGEIGQSYNVVNEDSHISIRNMAELVAAEIAQKPIKVIIDIPEDVASLGYASPVKMALSGEKMMALGWKPTVGLKEAYCRLLEYWEE